MYTFMYDFNNNDNTYLCLCPLKGSDTKTK